MNIIAEKLRQAYHNDLTDCPILLDGADEIDRLRKALEKRDAQDEKSMSLIHEAAKLISSPEYVDKLAAAEAEIDKLRTALSVTGADVDPRYQKYWTNLGRRMAAEEERDRLHAENRKLALSLQTSEDLLSSTQIECVRLREALTTTQCPSCKGKKGFHDTTYDRTGTWENCHKCDGTGEVFDMKKLRCARSTLGGAAE